MLINVGIFNKQLQAEQIVIEEVLKVDNIKLFSFNNIADITTDLNNYKDNHHYGEWINSLLIRYMKDNLYLLTKDNYHDYLQKERDFYWNYDYDNCFKEQEDYERDYYSEALLNERINGVHPYRISQEKIEESEISNARIIKNQHGGQFGILCKGTLSRNSESCLSVPDYIRQNDEFEGVKLSVENIDDYKYLVMYGKKIADNGQPSIYIYDESGMVVSQYAVDYSDLDEEWHQYLIDISSLKGCVNILLQGGYIDSSGSTNSEFIFSDISLY
ncbi:MAG: hypothetical protein K6E98_12925 [Lachnospiraceae bacterium]|nr:hypothetical protein [Lachnospiraceae bacterium]